jgi:hypothetical protein
MDPAAEELKVLMSEKEQADKQIGSYIELQLKLFAFLFSAGVVAGSWVFSSGRFSELPETAKAACALALAFIGCFAVLQSVVNYGIVLGYIRYKHFVVGDRIMKIARMDMNPFRAMATIASTRANSIVVVASVLVGVLVLVFNLALLTYAASQAEGSTLLWLAIGLCGVMLIGAAGCGIGLVREIATLKREMTA